MPNSFIQNVNTIAAKIGIIESANTTFNPTVMPILQEIALLDLDQAVLDLKKGNYLGNRKVDINLALNMVGITEALIEANPTAAEAIWTDPTKTVQYSSATVTFTDGVVIALPFIFDNAPTTVSTHADLLAQLSRLDYVTAIAQVDTINTFVAANATSYIVTINGVPITYVSDADATVAEIVAGLVTAINLNAVPVTAASILTGTAISLTADVAGTAFNAYVNANMAITTTTANRVAGPVETAFLAKLNHTLLASFASDVVGEIVRGYDVIGQNSNLERIQLHTASGSFIDANPIYYWAKTTSAFQTLSMRAGDIIKLGNDIDSIILLAARITEMLALQAKIPEFVTNVDSLYTNISKLVTIHTQITGLVAIYNDIKVGGTNYIQTVSTNIANVNTVATDLNLGAGSMVSTVSGSIANVNAVGTSITNVNTTATNITNINTVATSVVPNLAEILLADNNAATATAQAVIATAQAVIATTQAGIATTKSNEIKNVSVLSTTTGAAGTNANVIYNPLDGKFSFVVPQGVKGDKGDAFLVNAVGLFAGRSIYDGMAQGFSFLALDLSLIYFKLSATSGDWSAGAPFGKGDTGATGATGNGIVAAVFTSTTDVSGLAGKSGATDTYTITYTNATTSTFLVYNGIDGSVAMTKQDFVATAGQTIFTPTNPYTVGLLNVYVNGIRLPATDYTAVNGTTVTLVVGATVGDIVSLEAFGAFQVADVYTKGEVDAKDALKANQVTTYTKVEVDTALGLKADLATSFTLAQSHAVALSF